LFIVAVCATVLSIFARGWRLTLIRAGCAKTAALSGVCGLNFPFSLSCAAVDPVIPLAHRRCFQYGPCFLTRAGLILT